MGLRKRIGSIRQPFVVTETFLERFNSVVSHVSNLKQIKKIYQAKTITYGWHRACAITNEEAPFKWAPFDKKT
jgi:uncharacterized phage-associated protein